MIQFIRHKRKQTFHLPAAIGPLCTDHQDATQDKLMSRMEVWDHQSAFSDVWKGCCASFHLCVTEKEDPFLHLWSTFDFQYGSVEKKKYQNLQKDMSMCCHRPWVRSLALPGVCTTACMFFSCSCWMRSALALLSFSKQRTLCTYWLFKNFKSDVSWSSFLMWVLSSETRRDCAKLSHQFLVHEGQGYGEMFQIVLRRGGTAYHCLPLETRSFSSFSLRSSWCSSLFSLTTRAFSALYGSRRASKFRLSFSVFPADSLALRRLSVVWIRSLK